MDKRFPNKNIFKKILAYTSAAMLFTTIPTLATSAAENTQIPGVTDIPAQPESQPSSNAPAEASSASSSVADTVPAQNVETPVPQLPTDAADTTPQLPTDAATVTPLPEPAPSEQESIAVTPMQGTVYAASPKGLNVRSGPSTNHSKLGTLKYGEAITVTGVSADNWYQIQYSGGVGYILADYVSATPLTTGSPTTTTATTTTATAENPSTENPVTPDTAVGTPDTETVPDVFLEDEDDELLTDEDTFTGNPAVTGHLIGTPVLLVLGLAIVGIMALIGYTVYSLFKKEDETTDEYDEDDYYGDDQYYEDRYYEDEQYDDEYYENDQYPDSEYYEDELYSDEQYYKDEYDDEYYENDQYPDSEYYEDEQYSDDEYYENGQDPDNEYYGTNNKKH